MRLYRKADGLIVGTKDKAGKGAEPIDVPTVKEPLIDWLNDNVPKALNDAHPAFIQGRMAAERGATTNPYSSPDLRQEWERGHAYAVELGLGSLSSFAVRTRGVDRTTGKRRKK